MERWLRNITGLGVVLAVALGLWVPGGLAANSVSFSDPPGDHEKGAAPDITTVRVSNDDAGVIAFVVETPNFPELVSGMRIWIVIDVDANRSTGASALGIEFGILVSGSTMRASLHRYEGNTPVHIHHGSLRWRRDPGAVTITINRADLRGTAGFNFRVLAQSQDSYSDYAPAAASTFQFAVVISSRPPGPVAPDADGDGIVGASDSCPNTPAGRFDSNNNGCPGPFEAIEPRFGATAGSEGRTRFVGPAFTDLPSGALVTIRRSGATPDRTRVAAGGTASSRLLGTVFYAADVTITFPGRIGYMARIVAVRDLPFYRIVDKRCIPATGGRPQPCTRVPKGR